MSNKKIIYLTRHAQGEHNVAPHQPTGNSNVKDPNLTTIGRSQCHTLRETFPYHSSIEIIMSSPLRRTIQTSLTSFAPALKQKEIPVLLVPMAQEISDRPCDVGTDPAKLLEEIEALVEGCGLGGEFEEGRIDFGMVHEGWNSKEGIYGATLLAVTERAATLRNWLFQRPEKTIVLVTHGAFLHHLTEDWTGLVPPKGTDWLTTEFRMFTFDESSTKENAHLVRIDEDGKRIMPETTVMPPGAHAHDIKGVEDLPN
ncbi:histidine phosphatase superfamily [Tricladium varicosporioides]|nr:histidine phosphatase superfamily [Hymenoscyphus varicosporioides]